MDPDPHGSRCGSRIWIHYNVCGSTSLVWLAVLRIQIRPVSNLFGRIQSNRPVPDPGPTKKYNKTRNKYNKLYGAGALSQIRTKVVRIHVTGVVSYNTYQMEGNLVEAQVDPRISQQFRQRQQIVEHQLPLFSLKHTGNKIQIFSLLLTVTRT